MIYIKASEEVSSIYGNGAYKRYRKTREKEQGTKWNNQMVLNTLWNNTGHNCNNHNSTAPEVPILDFHDSTD